MEIKASAKHIRVTPRKLRLVAKAMKGKTAQSAIEGLTILKKSGAIPLKKVIESAVANAKKDNKKAENLKIKSIMIDEGPKWKKRDKSHRIFHESYITKRTSHINVILEG